jgi:hypothetical protein
MWLRRVLVKDLKRLREFDLDLEDQSGAPRMWTVLIGRNGTGKSSLLQAIALAAAGTVGAEELAGKSRESFPDKRLEKKVRNRMVGGEAKIAADFVFGPDGRRSQADHPTIRGDWFGLYDESDRDGQWLRSRIWIRGDSIVRGNAAYVDASAGRIGAEAKDPTLVSELQRTPANDPLVHARSEDNRPSWFVAGYGVQRDLPGAERGGGETSTRYPIARLRPLFTPQPLIGPNFQDLLGTQTLARSYALLLKKVLLETEALVPGITDIELRGKGGVTRARQLTESHRFKMNIGGKAISLPARWLSHGYQSSLAWIADLIGQIVLEVGRSLEPARMEGLVLIDEIDLYLHPKWQVGLIQALRTTLPRMQFIATTHSPILLSAFRREEVVILDFDDEGNVVRVPTPRDPRLLTGSELYEDFFGIDKLYPSELGDALQRYLSIATDPRRSDEEDQRALELAVTLRKEGVDPQVPLAPRSSAGRRG